MKATPMMNTNLIPAKVNALAAAIVLTACLGIGQAAVLTVNPIADTFLIASPSGTSSTDTYSNYGGSTLLGGSLYAGGSQTKGEYSLLRFDLSSIANTSTIDSVTLKLTARFSYSYSSGEALQIYQVASGNNGWVEGTGTGTTTTGATGRYLNQTSYTNTTTNAGTAWTSGGIFNNTTGDLGANVGSLSLGSGVTAGTTYSFSLTPSAIQSWLTDSNLENAGLSFHMSNNEGTVAANRFLYFYSMNSGAAAGSLPQLEITYTVPEPQSLALLALGVGAAYLKIRRKKHHS